MNIAYHPAFDSPALGKPRRRQDRPGHIFRGGCGLAAGQTLDRIDRLVELGDRLDLSTLDAVDALADPGDLRRDVASRGIDTQLQRSEFGPRLHDVLFERLDFLHARS